MASTTSAQKSVPTARVAKFEIQFVPDSAHALKIGQKKFCANGQETGRPQHVNTAFESLPGGD